MESCPRYITIILLAAGIVLTPVGLYLMATGSSAIPFVIGALLVISGIVTSFMFDRGMIKDSTAGSSESKESSR